MSEAGAIRAVLFDIDGTILVTGGAGTIGSTLVDRLLDEGREVIAVDNFDPLVGPQRPRQLPIAHVDRDHTVRAGPKQDIGKSTGGGTCVKTPATRDPQSERFERRQGAGQLRAATRHIPRLIVVRYDKQWIVGPDGGRGFGSHLPADRHAARDHKLSSLPT